MFKIQHWMYSNVNKCRKSSLEKSRVTFILKSHNLFHDTFLQVAKKNAENKNFKDQNMGHYFYAILEKMLFKFGQSFNLGLVDDSVLTIQSLSALFMCIEKRLKKLLHKTTFFY